MDDILLFKERVAVKQWMHLIYFKFFTIKVPPLLLLLTFPTCSFNIFLLLRNSREQSSLMSHTFPVSQWGAEDLVSALRGWSAAEPPSGCAQWSQYLTHKPIVTEKHSTWPTTTHPSHLQTMMSCIQMRVACSWMEHRCKTIITQKTNTTSCMSIKQWHVHLSNLWRHIICCKDLMLILSQTGNVIAQGMLTPDILCAGKWSLYCKCFSNYFSSPTVMAITNRYIKHTHTHTHQGLGIIHSSDFCV